MKALGKAKITDIKGRWLFVSLNDPKSIKTYQLSRHEIVNGICRDDIEIGTKGMLYYKDDGGIKFDPVN